MPWYLWAVIGPSMAGGLIGVGAGIGYGGYKLARFVKQRVTWLYGKPYPYIERGISDLERFANTSEICPCGCGQMIVKVR